MCPRRSGYIKWLPTASGAANEPCKHHRSQITAIGFTKAQVKIINFDQLATRAEPSEERAAVLEFGLGHRISIYHGEPNRSLI